MKLSVWSSFFYDLSPEDAILTLAKHGYHYCELSDEHAAVLLERGDSINVGRSFGEFSAAHGVSVSQGHLFLRTHICDPAHQTLLRQQVDLFCAIGIKNAVLHCDTLSDAPERTEEQLREKNLAALRELVAYIGARDLCICLENLRSVFVSSSDLLYYVNTLQSPHLGICLDTGHLNISKAQTQKEFIMQAGKHLRALHIADNEGVTDQHVLPFGRGTVPMNEVIDALALVGYDGLYNLEIPGEGRAPLKIRELKLDYIQKMFQYIQGPSL